ncbi:hypothetical protein BHF68_04975 [Desulfuribacillus alkaliarsenatis]|uniref:Rhodanese domain-containing protein n=1 Tax=Desulfuribacillus alkaliarsenatis TaxID=766136 RepID=A0A1E5G2F2_9FIRM|nr:hypothetical protein BHF68_04975 [Desulfuribacillus alkaliarsenatis]
MPDTSYQTVDIELAKELLESGEYTLIDVRSQSEYDDEHIIGAHLIPCEELETRINELNKDKNYMIICRSGNRSKKACMILAAYGFKNILNIDGGIKKWYNTNEKVSKH